MFLFYFVYPILIFKKLVIISMKKEVWQVSSLSKGFTCLKGDNKKLACKYMYIFLFNIYFARIYIYHIKIYFQWLSPYSVEYTITLRTRYHIFTEPVSLGIVSKVDIFIRIIWGNLKGIMEKLSIWICTCKSVIN